MPLTSCLDSVLLFMELKICLTFIESHSQLTLSFVSMKSPKPAHCYCCQKATSFTFSPFLPIFSRLIFHLGWQPQGYFVGFSTYMQNIGPYYFVTHPFPVCYFLWGEGRRRNKNCFPTFNILVNTIIFRVMHKFNFMSPTLSYITLIKQETGHMKHI